MEPARAAEVVRAAAPRGLRLEALLRELGARAEGPPREVPPPTLEVGALVDRAAEAGFGFLVGVLALIAIPFVGLSTPFGLAIALAGAQLAAGREHPYLPARLRRRRLPLTTLDRVLGMLLRRAAFPARWTRQRAEGALSGLPRRAVGLGVLLLGLALALPLPIPGSNLVFLVPLLIYALGLLERDGAWVVAGHVATLASLALLAAFGGAVVAALRQLAGWLGG